LRRGGPNGFVRVLGRLLALEDVGLSRSRGFAVAIHDPRAHIVHRVLGQPGGIRAHVGDEAGGAFVAQLDTLVEPLACPSFPLIQPQPRSCPASNRCACAPKSFCPQPAKPSGPTEIPARPLTDEQRAQRESVGTRWPVIYSHPTDEDLLRAVTGLPC